MKHYIAAGVLIVVGIIVLTGFISTSEPYREPQLGGITRTVSNTTSSVATSTATQVLDVDTRATFRRIQQNTNATVYCIEGATSTASLNSGIRLTQGQEYVWSSDKHNLWPGKISCISETTASVILVKQHYE